MSKFLHFIFVSWWLCIIKVAFWIVRFVICLPLGIICVALGFPFWLFGKVGLMDAGLSLFDKSIGKRSINIGPNISYNRDGIYIGGSSGNGSGGNSGLCTGRGLPGHPETSQW